MQQKTYLSWKCHKLCCYFRLTQMLLWNKSCMFLITPIEKYRAIAYFSHIFIYNIKKYAAVKDNQFTLHYFLTSRTVKWCFWSPPSISTVTLIKRKALVSCSCHHLIVLGQVLGFAKRFHFVHSSGICIRQVKRFWYRVHGQVVLMGWACAKKVGKDKDWS